MIRGDLVTVALSGDFGKPRPALVIQSDQFSESETVIVLLISSELVDAPLVRVTVEPDDMNRLHKTSQIMVDKIMTVRRQRVGPVFGRVADDTMIGTIRSLALILGFG